MYDCNEIILKVSNSISLGVPTLETWKTAIAKNFHLNGAGIATFQMSYYMTYFNIWKFSNRFISMIIEEKIKIWQEVWMFLLFINTLSTQFSPIVGLIRFQNRNYIAWVGFLNYWKTYFQVICQLCNLNAVLQLSNNI